MMKYLLMAIVLLAVFLRTYRLSSVPPGASVDEVSIGYNAFSMLMTGRDEYGYWWPLLLRAYDDWRPAAYVYLTVPAVALFGLTVVAVRIPSVVLSILDVLLIYLFSRELFYGVISEKIRQRMALLSALFLAISPWHIYLSRLGHEVNLGFTLVLLLVWTFIRYINNTRQTYWLYLSAVCAGFGLYTYQSEKIVVPALVFTLGLIYWRNLWQHKKQVFLAITFGIIVSLPMVVSSISPEGLLRLRATNVFTPRHKLYLEAVDKYAQAMTNRDLFGQIWYRRATTTVRIFLDSYWSHFSPKWLFTGGDREGHKVPGMGLLYIWEAISVIVGLSLFVRFRLDRRLLVILAILLSGPLPGAITTQAPHAMRSLTMLIGLNTLAAIGSHLIFKYLKHKINVYLLVVGVMILFFWSFFVFAKGYYLRFPREQSDSFQVALVRSLEYAISHASEYEQVVVTNEYHGDQAYMFYLFIKKYDPQAYQALGGTRSGGFAVTHWLDNFTFEQIDWPKRPPKGDRLYLVNPWQIPPDANVKEIFYENDGRQGIVAVVGKT